MLKKICLLQIWKLNQIFNKLRQLIGAVIYVHIWFTHYGCDILQLNALQLNIENERKIQPNLLGIWINSSGIQPEYVLVSTQAPQLWCNCCLHWPSFVYFIKWNIRINAFKSYLTYFIKVKLWFYESQSNAIQIVLGRPNIKTISIIKVVSWYVQFCIIQLCVNVYITPLNLSLCKSMFLHDFHKLHAENVDCRKSLIVFSSDWVVLCSSCLLKTKQTKIFPKCLFNFHELKFEFLLIFGICMH